MNYFYSSQSSSSAPHYYPVNVGPSSTPTSESENDTDMVDFQGVIPAVPALPSSPARISSDDCGINDETEDYLPDSERIELAFAYVFL